MLGRDFNSRGMETCRGSIPPSRRLPADPSIDKACESSHVVPVISILIAAAVRAIPVRAVQVPAVRAVRAVRTVPVHTAPVHVFCDGLNRFASSVRQGFGSEVPVPFAAFKPKVLRCIRQEILQRAGLYAIFEVLTKNESNFENQFFFFFCSLCVSARNLVSKIEGLLSNRM